VSAKPIEDPTVEKIHTLAPSGGGIDGVANEIQKQDKTDQIPSSTSQERR
jgi:hypothetical protein